MYPVRILTTSRSFFTAIYINGVPSSQQISCADMGQPNYCCSSGQSCAWDDAGKVACCASGSTCQGSAYGAGAGAGAGQYQSYSSPTTSYYQQQQPTTVYQAQSQGCNCDTTTTNYGNGGVVPIVPVTVATVLTPVAPTTTSYYVVPTSTYFPSTITTTPVAQAVTNNAACPGGYTTLTEANVGAPVRTVGCQIIFDSGARRKTGIQEEYILMGTLGFLGMVFWVA